MLNTLTGQETWRSGTWKFHVFVMHSPLSDGPTKEESLAAAIKGTNTGITRVRRNGSSPSQSNRKKELGYWTNNTYALPEGTILKIYGYRSAPVRGHRAFTVNQLVRMRADASYQKLSMTLSNNPEALHTEALVSGRFDIITADEAEGYGLRMHPRKRAMFDRAVDSTLQVTVIEEGLPVSDVIEAKTVITEDGSEERVVTRRRRRALD